MASELRKKKKKKDRGYDFSGLAQMAPRKEFKFGLRDSEMASVDASLAKLFQYLTVETSGILVQPQWKHFRHMEMMRNDQIRLSNGIWRSWHLQFQKNKKPLFCQFAINPLVDMETHHEPQAIVIEGKYWKRQTDAVACEYRKWRLFHRDRYIRSNAHRNPAPRNAAPSGTEPVNTQTRDLKDPHQQMQVDANEGYKANNVLQALDDLLPDSLFVEGGRPPYMRPFLDSSNMLQQPNLGMLNPTLDELLEKLEPMEVMLGQSGGPAGASVPQESSVQFFQPGEPPYGEAQSGPAYTSNQQQGFITKPVAINERRQDLLAYGNQFGGFSAMQTDTYSLSPSSFLSMPMKERTLSSAAAMEIGTPPTVPGFIPPGQVKMETSSLSQATTPQSHFVPTGNSPFHPPSGPPSASSGPITRSMSDPLFTGIPSQQHASSRYPPPHAPPLLLPQQQGAFVSAQTQTSPPPSASLTSPANTPHVNPSPSFQYPQHPPPPHHNAPKDSSDFPYPSPPPAQPYGGPIRPTDYWSPQDTFPQQRKTSGELHTPFTSPPPPSAQQLFSPQQMSSGGRNEPPPLPVEANLQVLAEQVQLLEQQQYQQLKEIEKQQSQATQEYLNLLQQYIAQSGSHPSQQQQQVLQSVLSDPATVNILKAVLLQGGDETVAGQKGLASKQKQREAVGESPSKSQVLSLGKVASVSDFQSRVVMAAAYQAANITSSAPATPTLTPSLTTKSLSLSPTGPLSPTTSSLHDAVLQKFKNARNLSQEEKKLYQEIRRQSHISAEQKRRGSIKQGFEHLQSLVVNPSSFPSGKVSKAVILEKTVEFLQHQHLEREAREKHIAELREEITQLNNSIALSQQQLPASGAPITRQRFEENKRYFREYLQDRTQHNYKFWLFSIILQQLFDTYNTTVSTGSREELCQTVLTWCEQNCTLPALRPVVMNTLKEISLKTCILSDPSKVPQQLSQQPPGAATGYSTSRT